MPDPAEKELLARVAELSKPSVRKTQAPSWRELCQDRARSELRRMLDQAGFESDTAAARHLGIDKRFLADCLKGARSVPLWLLYAFPRQGQLALVRDVLEELPAESADDDKVA